MVFLRIYIETWNLPAPYSSSLVLWWVGRCPLCHHIASEKQKLNLLLSYLAALHLAFLMLPITKQEKAMTRSQIKHRFLFQYVLNIMTACRMLQISIAQCQIEAEIHSFPTMYGKGGRCGQNWPNQGFRPRIRPKTSLFLLTEIWIISLQSGLGTQDFKGDVNFDVSPQNYG